MQRSFAEVDAFRKQRKVTRREVFLAEMARVVPWRRLEALIEPHYGRKPYPLGVMLRVHFLQHCDGYSDPAMEDALHDMPDETTILNFRQLLEAHQLAESLFQEVVSLLTEPGLILREGTIVDATLIAAPPSTENRDRQRDPGWRISAWIQRTAWCTRWRPRQARYRITACRRCCCTATK